MNWIILKLIHWISLEYDYNELNSNWLELDYIIKSLEMKIVVIWRFINITELN